MNTIRNIASVSLPTLFSRILGLGRDVLIFAALGASLWNSAFILAFTIPNLFRRLLGEGALTSAFVPIFSALSEKGSQKAAFAFLNRVLLRVFWILIILVVSLIAVLKLLEGVSVLPENWEISNRLAVWLMPYTLCICLAALITAALNVMGRFFVAASTPIILNITMIGSLACGIFLTESLAVRVYWLCGGVLLGGFFQFLIPYLDLKQLNWKFRAEPTNKAQLAELWSLFLPGLLGAAVLQINILVSRILAYNFNESGAALLYAAGRLMELPLGVFVFAITSVFFPKMARALASGSELDFKQSFQQGFLLIIAITIPAGLGLSILAQPIMISLFQWGAFTLEDVKATTPLVIIYGLGLPFYSLAMYATRGLHAGKSMRAPVRAALICLFINLFLALALMPVLGIAGLALSNVLAAAVQFILLTGAVKKRHARIQIVSLVEPVLKVGIAALGMAFVCWGSLHLVASFGFNSKQNAILSVLTIVPMGAILYGVLLYFLRFEGLSELRKLVASVIEKR